MEPKINIHRYLWSIKRERNIHVTYDRTHGIICTGAKLDTPKVRLPVVREASYRRSVDLPTSNSIESSGLSFQEFSLAAALVLSQRRRATPARRKQ